MPCHDDRPLTFETLLTDKLTRLVMESDGVSTEELVAVLTAARNRVAAPEHIG